MQQRLIEQMRQHSADEYPREACGLLVRDGRKKSYIRCENTAANKSDEFRISDAQYLAAEDMGEIIGVFHSHPDATSQASVRDRAMCSAGIIPWHIMSWPDGDFRTIVPEDAPLIGRPFAHGTDWDCYGLIRDWYKINRCVELPRFNHDRYWWELGEDLYLQHYKDAGFSQVMDGSIKHGDVILMQIQSNVINHGAVYEQGGTILHHLYGRPSGRAVYGGYWLERTRMVVRYTA